MNSHPVLVPAPLAPALAGRSGGGGYLWDALTVVDLALTLTLAVAVTVVAFQETETWSAMSQSAEAVVTSVHSQTDPSYNGGPGDTSGYL